jgi:hypothetical protein
LTDRDFDDEQVDRGLMKKFERLVVQMAAPKRKQAISVEVLTLKGLVSWNRYKGSAGSA